MTEISHRLIAIFPAQAETRPLDASKPANAEQIAGLQEMYASRNDDGTRKCNVITLSTGDRIITAPGPVLGPIDTAEKKLAAAIEGVFAVLKTPVTLDEAKAGSERLLNITAGSEEIVEIIGPALVVGPDDGTDSFPPTEIDDITLGGFIAWNSDAVRNKALRQLERFLADKLAPAADNDQGDDAFRAKLTDEQLEECGCPDCQKELQDREAAFEAKAAAKH